MGENTTDDKIQQRLATLHDGTMAALGELSVRTHPVAEVTLPLPRARSAKRRSARRAPRPPLTWPRWVFP